MLAALLLSFAVIFVAEMGDKSQLMAMMFALRYKWWVVLAAITAATTVVHVLSVAIGHYLGGRAADAPAWDRRRSHVRHLRSVDSARGGQAHRCDANRAQKAAAPAFFVVTSAFLLAELGDKTMLATITLAADNDWVGVWIGSTVGMVVADGLAILVGAVAGKHLPERLIQISAAAFVPALRRLHASGELRPDHARRADGRLLGRSRRVVRCRPVAAAGAVASVGPADPRRRH